MSQLASSSPVTSPLQDLRRYFTSLLRWSGQNKAAAFLLAAIAATFVYFYAFVPLYTGLPITAWARLRYQPGYDCEHGKLVPFIFLFLLWHHRKEIARAPKTGSFWGGLVFICLGLLLFALGFRTLQTRAAMFAVPFLFYGIALYLWGRHIGRIVLFPCAFLIFMIPVAAVQQATFRLQFLITGIVGSLSNLVGIQIAAVGTTLRALDGSFNFEIAEGCSGIRSLIAMVMLTAVYVHLTQKELWKKLVIFGCSALFAIIGNAGRIFTVVLVAKFWDPRIAAGIYHDYSGFLFFPIALFAMLSLSKLLNLKISSQDSGESGPAAKDRVVYDY